MTYFQFQNHAVPTEWRYMDADGLLARAEKVKPALLRNGTTEAGFQRMMDFLKMASAIEKKKEPLHVSYGNHTEV